MAFLFIDGLLKLLKLSIQVRHFIVYYSLFDTE